jgi:4-amino-4-deoxychorismate lyase
VTDATGCPSAPDTPEAGSVVADRGLLYGDGVFRTVRHGPQGLWDRDAQFELLAHDCHTLGFDAPGVDALDARIGQAVAACGAPQQVVRITVTRGSGPRGYRPPVPARPAIFVSAAPAPPLRAWDAGYALRLCQLRLGHQPRLAGAKHLNRLENVLARAEWDDPQIDDGVLLDHAGNVVETVSANLFWRCGDTVHAPALNLAGVAGRQRARILGSLRTRGANLVIGHFEWNSLAAADEIWVCNSVIGLRAVTAIASRSLVPGDTARELAKGLFADWRPEPR